MERGAGVGGASPILAAAVLTVLALVLFAVAGALLLDAVRNILESGGADEQLVVASVYALKEGDAWTVVLLVENGGLAPVTVKEVLVGGLPVGFCGGVLAEGRELTLEVNGRGTVALKLPREAGCGATRFRSGAIVEISLLTAGGKRFSVQAPLP
ncbi:MAG: hypothetical protein QXJ59_04515 [Thermofilaceae archaeon]